jgi:dynein heavy chain 1
LGARLQSGIQAWTNALNGTKKEIDLSMDTDAPAQPTHKPGGDPQVSSLSPESVGEGESVYNYVC